MRLKPVASVVLSCLGFTSPLVFAEDVMVVTASGYEKKIINAAAGIPSGSDIPARCAGGFHCNV